MKQWWLGVLIVTSGWLLGSSSAVAQDVRFGLRFGLDLSSALAIQVRIDDAATDGFGARVVIGSSLIISGAELVGFYRFGSDGRGSSGYVGMGFGVLVLPNLSDSTGAPPFVPLPYVTVVIGGEYALSERFTLFAELRLGPPFAPLPFLPLFGLGLNFYF